MLQACVWPIARTQNRFALSLEKLYKAGMRLKSEIVVSALLRRVFARGDFAAVERKGAPDAGAIFIRQRLRDGSETLYGPAPQSFADEEEGQDDTGSDRRFEKRLEHASPQDVDALLDKERRFDSDLWVVEIETDSVETLFTVVA